MAVTAILLPWVITVFLGSGIRPDRQEPDEEIIVCRDEVRYRVTEEEYLKGAFWAIAPEESREETLKALAVILRTELYRRLDEQKTITVQKQEWIPACQRAGASAGLRKQENRFAKAVGETEGLIMKWEGQIIEAPFHGISAGKTRTGSRPWLQGTESNWDRKAEEFLHVYSFSTDDLCGQFPGTTKEAWKSVSFVPEPDSSYIKEVTVGDQTYDGDVFRRKLDLCSAAYWGSWQQDQTLQIICQGQGHGLGFSCYGADAQAALGSSFQELLQYYYGKITLTGE